MSPLSGKQVSVELERLLQEAREGSGESLEKTLAVCREFLLALAAEELSGREGAAQYLVNRAMVEVKELLPSFDGSSEGELRAWLREIFLEQTRVLPGAPRPIGPEHAEFSTPAPGTVNTTDAVTPGQGRSSLHSSVANAAGSPNRRAELSEDAANAAEKTTAHLDATMPARAGDGPPAALANLEGFEIANEIGRGGMGIVYRAWQERLQRWVALKCLPRAFAEDSERLRRFRQEARLAAQLTEHGILQVYDVLEAGPTPILVLPYIEGCDLGRIIAQRRALRDGQPVPDPHPWAMLSDADYLTQLLPFFDKTLDALARLHSAGVLHRDLKPSNILVDKNGNGWLTDFGLARLSNFESTTEAGQWVGTRGFMSPEQWDGDDDIDARTDVFGMGVTLFQALMLELPYGKARLTIDTPATQLSKNQQRRLPANMDLVLLKAIQPDRRRRYESAADLRDDWQRVRKGQLPQKAPLGRGRRLLHAARRRPSQIVAALAVVLAVVFAAALLAPTPKVVRTVHVKTEPDGARVALVPLSSEDGTPQFDKAIQPKGRTPVTVPKVPPGEYLVVVEVENHGFHEVFRKVPEPGESTPTLVTMMFPHTTFEERGDKSIDLPSITIPKYDVRDDMAYFLGGEFKMGNNDHGPALIPMHSRSVEPFHLDKTEVTVAMYRRICKRTPLGLEKLSPKDDEPVRFVTFDEAVHCAELLGKRLPDEAEYEFAATNGGKSRFPWGDDAERITSWTFDAVGLPKYDRAVADPSVCGLFSNVAEWTSSWMAPYPGAKALWPEKPVLLHGEKAEHIRIVRGGPYEIVEGKQQTDVTDPKVFDDARWRQGISRDAAQPGLGFRCALSIKPHFPQ